MIIYLNGDIKGMFQGVVLGVGTLLPIHPLMSSMIGSINPPPLLLSSSSLLFFLFSGIFCPSYFLGGCSGLFLSLSSVLLLRICETISFPVAYSADFLDAMLYCRFVIAFTARLILNIVAKNTL